MTHIFSLENCIQNYDWGSETYIANFLGRPSLKREAELWMGAHPKAPSKIALENGDKVSLDKWIAGNPLKILGESIEKKFGQLPFLFKLLAAGKPLSIQAHPNIIQAGEGFKRENSLNISLNSPIRNYKDSNHKPEVICAISNFWALNGFRKVSDIINNLEIINDNILNEQIKILRNMPPQDGLKLLLNNIMSLQGQKIIQIVNNVVNYSKRQKQEIPLYYWILKLNEEYPNDIGCLFPLFLNLVKLKPGEAMFLKSGVLHSYLNGFAVELMANSDNVLRGGLTKKHIDIQELLRILDFSESRAEILKPLIVSLNESIYKIPVDDFALSKIIINKDESYNGVQGHNVEIMLCTKGNGEIIDLGSQKRILFSKGKSVVIPATVKYKAAGNMIIYKATA